MGGFVDRADEQAYNAGVLRFNLELSKTHKMCSSSPPPPRSCPSTTKKVRDYIFWFHVPKTGTSFGTVLIHHANASLPPDAAVSNCDKYLSFHDASVDHIPNFAVEHPYEPHVCHGASDSLFKRFTHERWFAGWFVCGNCDAHGTCDAGGHLAITDSMYAAHWGHFQGLFRSPLKLLPSQYLRSEAGGPGTKINLEKHPEIDFHSLQGKTAFLKWAKGNGGDGRGSQVKMLAPGVPNATAATQRAVGRLKDFRFIGITDRWAETVCLYHRMIMSDRPCLPIEFVNDRKTDPLLDTRKGTEILEAEGFVDARDTVLFAEVERIFEANLRDWDVSPENCAALGCVAAHAPRTAPMQ